MVWSVTKAGLWLKQSALAEERRQLSNRMHDIRTELATATRARPKPADLPATVQRLNKSFRATETEFRRVSRRFADANYAWRTAA